MFDEEVIEERCYGPLNKYLRLNFKLSNYFFGGMPVVSTGSTTSMALVLSLLRCLSLSKAYLVF
jgi:hypothetical protein